MAMIRLDRFGGIAPLHEPRRLPEPFAVLAHDVRFQGGALRPLGADQQVENFSAPLSHLMFVGSDLHWWPEQFGRLSSAVSPVPADPERRLYWSTESAPGGQETALRMETRPAPGQRGQLSKAVGILAPAAPPVLEELRVADSAVGAGTPRPITGMSNTAPITVTVNPHAFKEGQRVSVSFPAAGDGFPPDNADRYMRELNGREFIVTSVTSSGFALRGSDGTQLSAFNAAFPPTIQRVYGDADLVSRSYVYTFVSDIGEEGPPSPPSAVLDVRFDSRVRVKINTPGHPTDRNNVNRVRLYRAVSGSSRAGFFFVAEKPTTTVNGQPLLLEIDDTITEEALDVAPPGGLSYAPTRVLGELLPSTDWTAPPIGLRGLVQMPNGFMAAFKGNTLYFSEPYLPHAWPDKHRKTTNTDIRGIAVFGQTLVVATAGKPYIAQGTDPSSVSLQELDVDAACIAGATVCSIGSGVAFAAHDGLIVIGPGGSAKNLTEALFTKAQWQQRVSPSHRAVFVDRRYIMLSEAANTESWAIEFGDDGLVHFATLSVRGRAPAVNPADDALNFMRLSGGFTARMTHATGAPMPVTPAWSSKLITMDRFTNFACGQVFASGYPLNLLVRRPRPTAPGGQTPVVPNQMTVVTVTGPDAFRLPLDDLAREFLIDVQPNGNQVFSVSLAENMEELRRT